MNPRIQAALLEQANHELFAAHSYQALALWCAENAFGGFAEFFRNQAAEEREHADKFLDHLLDRGIYPELGAIEKPRTAYASLIEVAEQAQTLERINSENIRRCYEVALEVKDYDSHSMLLWFISEQVEEEAWAGTMVTLTKRCECPGAQLNLDRHIVKTLASHD
ncbi:MAG: ferritin [Verrucomicrobiota bacterium JB022]|nr:ferritin [Verrucomicrobiota bacterium JB022]